MLQSTKIRTAGRAHEQTDGALKPPESSDLPSPAQPLVLRAKQLVHAEVRPGADSSPMHEALPRVDGQATCALLLPACPPELH